jgi:hypothetical protein
VRGVFSDGFQTMLLSQASASAAFHDQTATGKLKAEMMPVTPSGCQVSYMRCWLAFGGDRQAVELAGYSLTCATVSLIGVFATSVPPVRGCGYNFDHRKGSRGFPRMPSGPSPKRGELVRLLGDEPSRQQARARPARHPQK